MYNYRIINVLYKKDDPEDEFNDIRSYNIVLEYK
jgi:hypothetical protein